MKNLNVNLCQNLLNYRCLCIGDGVYRRHNVVCIFFITVSGFYFCHGTIHTYIFRGVTGQGVFLLAFIGRGLCMVHATLIFSIYINVYSFLTHCYSLSLHHGGFIIFVGHFIMLFIIGLRVHPGGARAMVRYDETFIKGFCHYFMPDHKRYLFCNRSFVAIFYGIGYN